MLATNSDSASKFGRPRILPTTFPAFDYSGVEEQLVELMSPLLPFKSLAVYQGHCQAYNPKRDWTHFISGNDKRYAIAYEQGPKEKKDYYHSLLNLAASRDVRIEDSASDNLEKIIASFSLAVPLKEHLFYLYTLEDSYKLVHKLWYAETCNTVFYRSKDTNIKKTFSVRFDLCLCIESDLENQKIIHNKDLKCFLRSEEPFQSYEVLLSNDNNSISLRLIKEKVMEANAEKEQVKIPLSLCLGSIELTLDDVLSLRPGMEIEFPKPAELQGVLQVGNSNWVNVKVELESEMIKLHVNNLAGLAGAEKMA